MDKILIYVVPFLRVEDVLRVSCSKTVWDHFWFYYHKRCGEKKYLEDLKQIYYNNSKRAIVSYCIVKNWSRLSVTDQMQLLCTRKHILYYFIGLVVKHGKSIVYKYNKHIQQIETKNRYQRNARIKWMISSWQLLRGSRNDIFRRHALLIK